jgi:hypothetical protein
MCYFFVVSTAVAGAAALFFLQAVVELLAIATASNTMSHLVLITRLM